MRSQKVHRALAQHQIVGSMVPVGSARDNADMESFFVLLQKNVLSRRRWATRDELRIAIVTWIERTDHRRRRQDSANARRNPRANPSSAPSSSRLISTRPRNYARTKSWWTRPPGSGISPPCLGDVVRDSSKYMSSPALSEQAISMALGSNPSRQAAVRRVRLTVLRPDAAGVGLGE